MNKSQLLDTCIQVKRMEQVAFSNLLKNYLTYSYNYYNRFMNDEINSYNYTVATERTSYLIDLCITVKNNNLLQFSRMLENDIKTRLHNENIKKAKKTKNIIHENIAIVPRVNNASIKKESVFSISNSIVSVARCRRELTFCNYVYNKLVRYSKNKIMGIQNIEGEYTLEYVVNSLYTKYLELLFNNYAVFRIDECTIEQLNNNLIHLFAYVKKSLACLNYGTSAHYTENKRVSYEIIDNERMYKKTIEIDNIEYGSNHFMNTRRVTIIDLCKQWEHRNNTRERNFYYFDDGTSEDFEDKSYDIMCDLVHSSAMKYVNNIKQNTKNIERIYSILRDNGTSASDRKCLSDFKKNNNLQALEREELYYLFCIAI